MKILLRHILPFLLALAAWYFLRHRLEASRTQNVYHSWSGPKNYLAVLGADSNAQAEIHARLQTNGLLLFGSSELGSNSKYLPFRFFNQSINTTTGVGHAGNQCFQVLASLLPFTGQLRNAKITIILSPGWFEEYGEGTNPANFVANISEKDLLAIYFNREINEKYKVMTGEYINKHYSAFNNPHAIASVLKARYQVEKQKVNVPAWISYRFFDWYCRKKLDCMACIKTPRVSADEKDLAALSAFNIRLADMDWDSIAHAEKEAFKLTSTNNRLYVNDEYYSNYLSSKPYRAVNNFDYKSQQEWADFKHLVMFLKEQEADAFFVMQPLNPHYFQNLEVFDPLMKAVKFEIEASGFEWYNMFVSKTEQYIPGVLTDVMHMGDYGWMQADSAIINHYGKRNQ